VVSPRDLFFYPEIVEKSLRHFFSLFFSSFFMVQNAKRNGWFVRGINNGPFCSGRILRVISLYHIILCWRALRATVFIRSWSVFVFFFSSPITALTIRRLYNNNIVKKPHDTDWLREQKINPNRSVWEIICNFRSAVVRTKRYIILLLLPIRLNTSTYLPTY